MSLKRTGSWVNSSGVLPATAFSPTVGIFRPSTSQNSSSPSSTMRGAWSRNFLGTRDDHTWAGSTMWSSTLNNVLMVGLRDLNDSFQMY